MFKYLALVLAGVCGSASAQTPATNPMPDGSRDMYVGLGAQYAPKYDGSRDGRTRALPVLQVQWSNGIFVSGMSAGMHLSNEPSMEFGPLLALAPKRDESGTGGGIGGVDEKGGTNMGPSTILPPGTLRPAVVPNRNRLVGMDTIDRRLLGGAFFNYYLSPNLRLVNNVLYGAGNDHNGLRLHTGLQYMLPDFAAHHALVLSAGVSVVNRAQNAYFGVTKAEAVRTGLAAYEAGAGVQDVRLGLRWNWKLTPGWMLTSGVQSTRLLGDAKDSPLVERKTNTTISTALAYRF